MIRSFIRHLFPKVRNVDKLPLLPLSYWSDESAAKWKDPHNEEFRLLKGHSAARTDEEARRILRKKPDQPLVQTIKEHQRQRRRHPRIARAWKRFKRLWQ